MRIILPCFIFIFSVSSCKSQSPKTSVINSIEHGEFNKNANGLIYSEHDVSALKFVVDSLNLKFKSCELNKKYLSYPQTKTKFASFESKTNSLLEIKKDIENGIEFLELIDKYREFLNKSDSSTLVIETPYKEKGKSTYLTGNAFSGFNENYAFYKQDISPATKWVFDYEKRGEYSNTNTIECWYLSKGFLQQEIYADYARLIQYIDCMIDTSVLIYTGKNNSGRFEQNTSAKEKAYFKEINQYINTKMGLIKKKDDYLFEYLSADKINYAKTKLINDLFLKEKLTLIADVYLKNETGNDSVEELIAYFVSKEKALEIKRKRIVYGQCSMDNSPRLHAKNIASLSAETHSWDIFLRAHLNIMNDRFDRISDGSYAWGRRQTYIKELEILDINVNDLMLGLSLRAYNNSQNHYNGTVWRIGKALSEAKDRLLFEERAITMIKDKRLDEFNRSLVFLLYHTYLNHLADKTEKASKVAILKKNISSYPDFIQLGINKIALTSPD
jgi:hypothetical protein